MGGIYLNFTLHSWAQMKWLFWFLLSFVFGGSSLPKVTKKISFTVPDREGAFELLYFAPSSPMSRNQMQQLNLRGLGTVFHGCFGFGRKTAYSDYEVLTNYLHGGSFDAFILCHNTQGEGGETVREVVATQSLAVQRLSSTQWFIATYNLCVAEPYRGSNIGTNFIRESQRLCFEHWGIVPTPQHPVLQGLSMMVTSPTFLGACGFYEKLGYRYYLAENIAYATPEKLLHMTAEILGKRSQCPFSFDNQGTDSSITKLSLSRSSNVFSLLRVIVTTDESTYLEYPPTSFCGRILKSAEQNAPQAAPNLSSPFQFGDSGLSLEETS